MMNKEQVAAAHGVNGHGKLLDVDAINLKIADTVEKTGDEPTAEEMAAWDSAREHDEDDTTWVQQKAELQPKPKIVIRPDEPVVIDEATAALATDTMIFKRGESLVRVLRDEREGDDVSRPAGAPYISPLLEPTVRERLAGCANLVQVRQSEDGETESAIHPPAWLVKAIMARGRWKGIRRLEGIVEEPVLRPDGTVLDVPGYDRTTGLLYEPQRNFPAIATLPSFDDAKRALSAVLEVVADFPFQLEAHRSGWLAGVLTPFARPAIKGPCPLFATEANTRGTGKGLLNNTFAMLVTGREMTVTSYPENDTEMRKRITSIAIEGDRMMLFDNINGTFGCASLDAALTANTWKDRILGVSKTTGVLPLKTTWYCTGNNIIYHGDTSRRVIPIRLRTELERPEERSGFKHPNLLKWLQQERPRLVADCLTILRAFVVAGRPDQGLKPLGSFEDWSNVIRQTLVWVGMQDPAAAREEVLKQGDREGQTLRALITGWEEIDPNGEGLRVSEVFQLLAEDDRAANDHRSTHTPRWQTLRAAIIEACPTQGNKLPSARSLGMKLHHMRERVVGGKMFQSFPHNGVAVWKVVVIGPGESGTTGTTGTNSSYPACEVPNHCELSGAESSPLSPVSPTSFDQPEHNDDEMEFPNFD